jgi:hypothetical protein
MKVLRLGENKEIVEISQFGSRRAVSRLVGKEY